MKDYFVGMIAILLLLTIGVFSACTPEEEDYTSHWLGSWKTTNKLNYPLSKVSYSGEITKVPNKDNQVLVGGELFDLNSSFVMPMKINSTYAASFDYTAGIKLEGTARLNAKYDTIVFFITVTSADKSIKDTIIATKN